jgi:hypothetical protein
MKGRYCNQRLTSCEPKGGTPEAKGQMRWKPILAMLRVFDTRWENKVAAAGPEQV